MTSSYTAVGLNAGTTYEFKVESRNSYGYSTYSGDLSLLCAFIAEPSTQITSTNLNNQVIFDWTEPVSNGSPITEYKLFIRQSDQSTFT